MSTNFEDLILRDTRANQPAAGVPGRLYYVTDENVTERDNGATWDDVSDSGGGAGSDTTAIHDNTSGEIHAVTEKATPVDADEILIEDSAASYAKKRVQIGNLPGGGATIYESAYASPPTPADGDDWHVSDGGLIAHRASSAWTYYGWLPKLTLPPALSNWTGDNVETYFNTTEQGVIHFVVTHENGDQIRGYHRSYPATPKVTAAFLIGPDQNAYAQTGIFVSDGTKFKLFGFDGNNSGHATWFSVAGTWAGEGGISRQVHFKSPMLWMQYEEDGSNRYFRMSPNGIYWMTYLVEDKTTYVTGNVIGFGSYISAAGLNSGPAVVGTLLSWKEE